MSSFLLIAKAGGSGEAAENTCEAIQRCRALRPPAGVDLAIEIDLRLTAESQLVAMHDACLDRTTDGRGLVRQREVQELRRLKAGTSGERIPTLGEVLEAAGDAPLLLDLHDNDMAVASAVCRELSCVRQQRRDLIWVASEHGRIIRALRDLAPNLRTAATKREAWGKLLLGWAGLGRWAPRGHVWILPENHLGLAVVTPRFVERARAMGDGVWVFVVDDSASFARLRGWGVTGCVTSHPGRLARATSLPASSG